MLADKIYPVENCTNGLVLEVYRFFKQKRLQSEKLFDWLRALLPTSIPEDLSVECVSKAVKTKLHGKRDVLRQKRKTQLKDFENKLFVFSDIYQQKSNFAEVPVSTLACQADQWLARNEGNQVVPDLQSDDICRSCKAEGNELQYKIKKKRRSTSENSMERSQRQYSNNKSSTTNLACIKQKMLSAERRDIALI